LVKFFRILLDEGFADPYSEGLLYRTLNFAMVNIVEGSLRGAGVMFHFSPSHGFAEALWQVLRLTKARCVPILLSAVLLTATALKMHQLATGPVVENSLFTTRWFLIGLVEFELALGLWLLIGAYPRQARLAALMAFAVFCVVSLYQALSGEESCGCFGKAPVSPWYTALFDLAAVAALWFWHPETASDICTVGGGGTLLPILSA
jgi:hypothetical protein